MGYTYRYITHILNTYKIPFINLIKNEGNIYINLKPKFDEYITNNSYFDYNKTDILIVYHNFSDLYNINEINKLDNEAVCKSINNINQKIVINSNTYVLDCCIIMNYYDTNHFTYSFKNDKDIPMHAISGITCCKNQYIIDSSNARFTENNNLLIYDWYNKLTKNNELMSVQYDKTSNIKSINLDKSSIMDEFNIRSKGFTYNYKNSRIIYIYIKESSTSTSIMSEDIKSFFKF